MTISSISAELKKNDNKWNTLTYFDKKEILSVRNKRHVTMSQQFTPQQYIETIHLNIACQKRFLYRNRYFYRSINFLIIMLLLSVYLPLNHHATCTCILGSDKETFLAFSQELSIRIFFTMVLFICRVMVTLILVILLTRYTLKLRTSRTETYGYSRLPQYDAQYIKESKWCILHSGLLLIGIPQIDILYKKILILLITLYAIWKSKLINNTFPFWRVAIEEHCKVTV